MAPRAWKEEAIEALINFDRTVDPPNKGICGQEPDSACQQAIHGTCEETVAEEEQSRHKAGDVQLEHIVPDAVGEDPKSTAATCQEALPPPMVVLENY